MSVLLEIPSTGNFYTRQITGRMYVFSRPGPSESTECDKEGTQAGQFPGTVFGAEQEHQSHVQGDTDRSGSHCHYQLLGTGLGSVSWVLSVTHTSHLLWTLPSSLVLLEIIPRLARFYNSWSKLLKISETKVSFLAFHLLYISVCEPCLLLPLGTACFRFPPTQKRILFMKKAYLTDERILYGYKYLENCFYSCFATQEKIPWFFDIIV